MNENIVSDFNANSEEAVDSPADDIHPKVTVQQVIDLTKNLYGLTVVKLKQLNGYDDRNYHLYIDAEHDNDNIDEVCDVGYVLKIINTDDSKWPQAVDMHIHAMFCLNENGINAPRPIKNINGQYFSEEEFDQLDGEGNKLKARPRRHLVRLSTFIPGHVLYNHPNPSLQMFRDVGKLVADVSAALSELDHHKIFTLPSHGTVWLMKNHYSLKNYIYATRGAKRREMLTDIVRVFKEKVLDKTDNLTQAIIHDDINEQNILVQKKENPTEEEEYEICGLLDFTDINKSCKVFDIAITMMYMMTVAGNKNFIKVGAAVLQGYLETTKLTKADLDVLPYAVVMRYALSLGMGEHGVSLNPGNLYLLTTGERGWDQMETLWTMPWEELRAEWGI